MRRTHRVKRIKARLAQRSEQQRGDQPRLSFNELRHQAKEAGINTFGLSRDEIEQALQAAQ